VELIGATPDGRRDENDTVSSNKEHGNVALSRAVDFFIGLLVNLNGGDGLFNVTKYHVQMLVVSLKRTQFGALLRLVSHYKTCKVPFLFLQQNSL